MMKNYVIYTDSACDIPAEQLAQWGVKFCSLSLVFDDAEKEYRDGEIPFGDFYQKMREGGVAKTAAVNVETFRLAFEQEAKQGNGVLYLGFSSGLSTTYNSGRLAIEQMKIDYPELDFAAVDTLCASAGGGLLVYLAAKKQQEGADLATVAAFAEQTKLQVCHWFTVDDLVYLKRGGRVSAATAFFGNALGIKPVMHVDNEGHLVNVEKVRGRKTALRALVDKVASLSLDLANGPIFLCHGDCEADVEAVRGMLREKCGKELDLVVYTGTVIGSHSGPGTLAIFFLGKER